MNIFNSATHRQTTELEAKSPSHVLFVDRLLCAS